MKKSHLCLKVVEKLRFGWLICFCFHRGFLGCIQRVIKTWMHKTNNIPVFQVWRINGSAKTSVLKEDIGKFYSGDCYFILYTFHSNDKKEDYYLCCWIGKDSIEVIYIATARRKRMHAYRKTDT